MRRRATVLLAIAIACSVSATHAAPADMPPEVIAEFTRRVQPLLVNRCANGACHGMPNGHEPRFARGHAALRPDRTDTLANMRTLLEAIGDTRDPQPLVTLLASGHPAKPASSRLTAKPLSAGERLTLESWLTGVRLAEHHSHADSKVVLASAEEAVEPLPPHPPVPPVRNRFRDLLDAAANPPELPPPPEPQGVIFPNDHGETPEPPTAPLPPLN